MHSHNLSEETAMPPSDDKIDLNPVDPEILEHAPKQGLGEFAETIIDEDGQLDPEVLEEPTDDD